MPPRMDCLWPCLEYRSKQLHQNTSTRGRFHAPPRADGRACSSRNRAHSFRSASASPRFGRTAMPATRSATCRRAPRQPQSRSPLHGCVHWSCNAVTRSTLAPLSETHELLRGTCCVLYRFQFHTGSSSIPGPVPYRVQFHTGSRSVPGPVPYRFVPALGKVRTRRLAWWFGIIPVSVGTSPSRLD
jgi:hypothetical protein